MHRLFSAAGVLLFALSIIASAQSPTLDPKTKAAVMTPAAESYLRAKFADPPAEYRSMPLWVWNDLLEWPRLRQQLGQFKEQGIGGVFIHPRPGLMTEYLGEDWFRLWKQSIEEGKRLGLLVNIYDENSYPSGFSGGYVPSKYPDTAAQYVQAGMDAPRGNVFARQQSVVSVFALKKNADGAVVAARRVKSSSEIPAGWSVAAFRLRRASGNPWTGEFPYVDLTNPQTTAAFLETTYELYRKQIGNEFGNTVRWAFTDEPLIATAGAYDSAWLALPLSYNTLAEFQKRNGYDLADGIAWLFWDVGEYRKVRFDYWQTLHDLWKENFMKPMFEWCDRNNLQFTGHWMEHEWPYPWITPDDASLYAFEHVPGIDLLEGTNLRTKGKDPHLLFTVRQVASVSHQLGRRAFCEAYGVAGWDSTIEHYKRFGDWLMVHGINFMNQHLAFSTVRGARKRDHPQSFTDVSPWWPYYRLHADHLARVSMLSSRSESRNRVLVLEQTTSGFLHARRAGPTPELDEMRARNADLNQTLADHQIDYDLGDEYMIEWFGKEPSRRFTIGRATYDLVVWPPDMVNVRSQTVPHLERYLASGGQVLALSSPAGYVDGRQSDAVTKLVGRYKGQWQQVNGASDLVRAIREHVKPRVRFDSELPNVGLSERWLENGDRVLFLANTGLQSARSRATVEGRSLEVWDTVTGRTAPARYTNTGKELSFDVDLAPAGSLMLVVKAAPGPGDSTTGPEFAPLQTARWRIRADAPNVLPLDYCDLKVAGQTLMDVNTWQANWTIWQRHGFERPAWDNAVQFKTRVFDRNKFDKQSGFEAGFSFYVADAAALKGLELAIESPELYRVQVNGRTVDFGAGKRWLDPHIRSIPIGDFARAGQNTLTIAANPFDVKMELENVYLRGNFAVEPAEKGFRIAASRELGFGSWSGQGYSFYGDSVTYETELEAPQGSRMLRVEMPEWQGSVASVLLDGKPSATIAWQPFRADLPVAPGRHTLAVRVVSTPRNTFGPFHHPSKPRMRAWPAAWAEFPDHQPAGAQYDLIDYGLMKPPVVSAAR